MSSEPKLRFKDGTLTEIQELMTTNVVTVRQTETVRDVLNKMTDAHISAIPVLDASGGVVGVVSVGDMLRIVLSTEQILDSNYPHYDDCLWAVDLIQQRLGSDNVTTVMTEIVTTMAPDQPMHHAACTMLNNHIHHLPIVNSGGQLVGILSSRDFVKLVAGIR